MRSVRACTEPNAPGSLEAILAEGTTLYPALERARIGLGGALVHTLPVRASLVVCVVALVGCGGGTTAVRNEPNSSRRTQTQSQPTSVPRAIGSGRSISDPVQLCHMNGGPGRTDYSYIASYRCADGTMPLAGDPERGAQARVGNVGPGPDGHIVDLYEVPCRSAPVRIHVDAYHCGDAADTTVDMARLSREQLEGMARAIRAMHADPTTPQGLELRAQLLTWVMDTQQLTVVMCDGLTPLLPMSDAHPYLPELMLSMTAAIIEDGRDPADPVRVHLASIQGLLVYYQAVLAQEGPSARNPQLDALLAMAQNGTLTGTIERALMGCDVSRLGVHFSR